VPFAIILGFALGEFTFAAAGAQVQIDRQAPVRITEAFRFRFEAPHRVKYLSRNGFYLTWRRSDLEKPVGGERSDH
jgi:hypothetical protein